VTGTGFNPFDRSWWGDPYPTYRSLLDGTGAGRVGGLPVWYLARHRDCESALRDQRLVVDDRRSVVYAALGAGGQGGARSGPAGAGQADGGPAGAGPARSGPADGGPADGGPAGAGPAGGGETGGEPEDIVPRSLLRLDPPDHTRLRALVASSFTRRAVEELDELIAGTVERLVGALGQGEVDLVSALGYPLPTTVICDLLGVPEERRGRLAALSRHVAAALDPELVVPHAQREVRRSAFTELRAHMKELLERPAPGTRRTDIVEALAASTQRGGEDGASSDEVVSMLVLLLVAGYETTANLIGNTALLLARRPDLAGQVRGRREAVAALVEEVLRLDPPVQLTSRITTEELDLAGLRVPAGHFVLVMLGAANRDPLAFERAEDVVLGREGPRHLSFSGGVHHCLGAHLARAEARAAIFALLERWPLLDLVEPPSYRETLVLRGLDELRVAPAA